jgi:hypothetical protein
MEGMLVCWLPCFVEYLLDDDDAGDDDEVLSPFRRLDCLLLRHFLNHHKNHCSRGCGAFTFGEFLVFFWEDSFVRQLFVLIDASKSPSLF